jgi:hypothetical protein
MSSYETLYSPRDVKHAQRHHKSFWANPKNTFHSIYQKAVTRRVSALICLLLLYAASTPYKPLDVVFTLSLVFLSSICAAAVLTVIMPILQGLIEWFSGY